MGSWEADPRLRPGCRPSGLEWAGLRNMPSLVIRRRLGGREGGIKAQALFDPFLGKDGFDPAQMRGQTARLRSRRPTSQRGTLRRRVAAPAQEGPWQDGRGVSFVSLLAGRSRSRGQRQQQPPGQTDGGHFLRSGPSHSPEPRATDNRALGTAAGEVTSHLGRNANPFQEAAGDRRRLQGWEPSHAAGSGRTSRVKAPIRPG